MKTKFTKLAVAAAVIAITTFAGINTSTAAEKQAVTELPVTNHINKITVSGNVELYITQSNQEDITVYDTYYSNNAVVKQENGELKIASYGQEKLAVWVHVTDLRSVEANGNATVRSLNKISALDLAIKLNDFSTANIEAEAFNLSTTVNDFSRLELSGESDGQKMVINGAAKVNATRFAIQTDSVQVEDRGEVMLNNAGKKIVIKAAVEAGKNRHNKPVRIG